MLRTLTQPLPKGEEQDAGGSDSLPTAVQCHACGVKNPQRWQLASSREYYQAT
jgi:hypothetical protein